MRKVAIAALAFVALALTAGGPPEVVRIRIPHDKLSSVFPPGSELRMMPVAEFEDLVRAARASSKPANPGPRLLSARHAIEWREGRLLGRTELLIKPSRSGAAALELVPWSPAIRGDGTDLQALRSRANGRLALWIETGPTRPFVLTWELRARQGSGGRVFPIGLPHVDVAAFELDLPEGLMPEGLTGICQGPLPGSGSGRTRWHFDGADAGGELRLLSRSPSDAAPGHPQLWVGGTTRVDVAEGTAAWRGDWQVHFTQATQRRLIVEVDAGLELLEVTGPAVLGYAEESVGDRRRVSVRFDGGGDAATSLTLRGTVRVPEEGTWIIPAARPIGTAWIGGRTTVHMGPTRVLEDCRERAGIRVAPLASEIQPAPPGNLVLAFAASTPSSVAELTFRRPEVDASAEVWGDLRIGPEELRIEAEIRWRVEHGRLSDLGVDLPSGWMPERVQLAGAAEAVSWQTEPSSGGGSRILVHLPPTVEDTRSLRLLLSARAPDPGRHGSLALPRLLPAAARVADEVWLARADRECLLDLETATGLAWLDPGFVGFPPAAVRDAVFAWRWTRPDGAARIRLNRRRAATANEVHEQIAVHGPKLSLDARLTLDLGDELAPWIVLGLSEPIGATPVVRLQGEEGGPPLVLHSLDAQARTQAGMANVAAAWLVGLPQPRRGRLNLKLSAESSWSGQGPIPLVRLSHSLPFEGTVSILADPSVRTSFEVTGLTRLAGASGEVPTVPSPDSLPRSQRLAQAFSYSSRSERLTMRTQLLEPVTADGFISDARLTTIWSPTAQSRHELVLTLGCAGAASLGVDLPQGCALERAELDGRPIVPHRGEGALLIVPIRTSASRPGFAVLRLDYSTRNDENAAAWQPRFTWPCLSSVWSFEVPKGFDIESDSRSFVAQDSDRVSPWDAFGVGAWSVMKSRLLRDAGRTIAPDATPRWLAPAVGASTLGEAALRWDAGPRPVVVDRLAMSRVALSPRTLIRSGSRVEALAKELSERGVAVLPRRDSILVTTRSEAASSPTPQSVHVAIEAGTDVTDRYTSAGHWWTEAPPAGTKATDSIVRSEQSPAARISHDSATVQWPTPHTLVPVERTSPWPWVVGIVLVALGIAAVCWPLRRRAAVLAVVVAFVAAGAPWLADDQPEWVLAPVLGLIGATAFWAGRALRPGARPITSGGRSSLTRRASARTTAAAGCVGIVSLVVPAVEWGRAGADETRPVLAIYPEEPAGTAEKVLLLLSDFERLHAATREHRTVDAMAVGASAAEHVVSFHGLDEATVETRLTLWVDSGASGSWSFPVDGARDIFATLDGHETSLRIEPGGRSATLVLKGCGRHELVVRRSVAMERDPRRSVLLLPINPVAHARLQCAAHEAGRKVEVSSTRGELTTMAGVVEGRLGPVDRLELQIVDLEAGGRPAPQGSAEAIMLWDAEPAGDRLRARIVYHNAQGATRLRLGLDPGTLVLSAKIPGLVETTWAGTPERPEWVAHVDPGLAEAARFELILWRPLRGDNKDAVRRLPRLEPLEVTALAGTVAFRRPADWSGRLHAVAGSDPVPEEVFARAWGELPDAALTLAGAIRFAVPPKIDVATGPLPVRATARPEVDVELQPGRLVVQSRIRLAEIQGRLREIALPIPGEFRLVHVGANGLTSWDRRSRELLRLRFDGPDAGPRTLTIEGWLPLASEVSAEQPNTREVPVPWIVPADLEQEAGTMAIVAPRSAAVRVHPGRGGSAPVRLEEAATPRGERSVVRSVYRIDSANGPGSLRWSEEPGRSLVTIRSLLAVYPESAEWIASLHVTAASGPARSVLLKAPRAWPALTVVNDYPIPVQVVSESKGEETLWTIRFENPIWNSPAILLRSSRPWLKERALDFPDVVPLGRGVVDTYLGLVNASGIRLAVEGSAELQPLDPGRFPTTDLPPLREAIEKAYRVQKEGWSLRIRPRAPEPRRRTEPESSYVSYADLQCTLAPDGTVRGQARYEVEPQHGAFLVIVLPLGVSALGAVVDGMPTQPIRHADGPLEIPLLRPGATRVELAWEEPPRPGATSTIRLPALAQSGVPTAITVHRPDTARLTPARRSLKLVGPGDLEAERAEWLARRAVEVLGELDAGSAVARSTLLEALVRFEVAARSASRAATLGQPGQKSDAVWIAMRLDAARRRLTESIQATGLEGVLRTARARIGRGRTNAADELEVVPSLGGVIRIPRLGHAAWFRTTSSSDPSVLQVAYRWVPQPAVGARPLAWARWAGGFLAVVLLPWSVRWLEPPRGRLAWAYAAGVTLVGILAGPLATAVALGMLALGRLSRA